MGWNNMSEKMEERVSGLEQRISALEKSHAEISVKLETMINAINNLTEKVEESGPCNTKNAASIEAAAARIEKAEQEIESIKELISKYQVGIIMLLIGCIGALIAVGLQNIKIDFNSSFNYKNEYQTRKTEQAHYLE